MTIAVRVDKAAKKAAEDKGEGKAAGRLKTFLGYLGAGETDPEIVQLRSEVEDWVGTYPLPWEPKP